MRKAVVTVIAVVFLSSSPWFIDAGFMRVAVAQDSTERGRSGLYF